MRGLPAHEKGRPNQPCDWLNRPLTVRRLRYAEGKRFELLVRGYRTLVFKTSSFGRSDNLPQLVVFHRHLLATKQAMGRRPVHTGCSQDLNHELLLQAKKAGCLISIDTDAHHPPQLAFIELGLAAALKAKGFLRSRH